MESVKFQYVERNLKAMVNQLNKNQNLIRYVKYLSNAPLDPEVFDNEGNVVEQPDFDTDSYDLISDGVIDFRLFNPNIMETRLVKIFFSHKEVKFADPKASSQTVYCISIVVPYENEMIQSTREIRSIRIANEICKTLDQKEIDDIGAGSPIFCTLGRSYVVSNTTNYEGLDIYILLNDTVRYH